jgi:hypothetical protein
MSGTRGDTVRPVRIDDLRRCLAYAFDRLRLTLRTLTDGLRSTPSFEVPDHGDGGCAISRTQCLAYLVASPRLLDANCRTVEQMRLANALCRLVEVATSAFPRAPTRL